MFFSPTRPSERVLNSGGPPMIIVLAMGLSWVIDVRWCCLAKAWVTVTESLSCAVEGLRISSEDGSLAVSAESTSAVVAALLVVSTEVVSSAPLYSGMTVIAPFSIWG